MQVNHVAASYREALPSGLRGEMAATAVAGDRAPDPELHGEVEVYVEEPAAVLRRVLGTYDVADITPAEFSARYQQLQDGAALDDDGLRALAAVRIDLDHDAIEIDEALDLRQYYRQKIGRIEQPTAEAGASQKPPAGVRVYRQRLQWMEKLALAHQTPDALGLDEAV